MSKLSVPASSEGKFDKGIPIYVTGDWKRGLTGGYDEIFGKFQEAGFGAYRWDKPEHNAHGDSDQFASIKSAFGKIQAFVMLSENPVGGGASQLMLGAALMGGMPVVFCGSECWAALQGGVVKPGPPDDCQSGGLRQSCGRHDEDSQVDR